MPTSEEVILSLLNEHAAQLARMPGVRSVAITIDWDDEPQNVSKPVGAFVMSEGKASLSTAIRMARRITHQMTQLHQFMVLSFENVENPEETPEQEQEKDDEQH